MSTNSVSAPAWLIASTVAMNVCATVTTASPRPDAGRHQREPHGVGAVGHAHAILRAAVVGELALEALDLRAADERGRAERLTKRRDELVFELAMRRDQIEKWNWCCVIGIPYLGARVEVGNAALKCAN